METGDRMRLLALLGLSVVAFCTVVGVGSVVSHGSTLGLASVEVTDSAWGQGALWQNAAQALGGLTIGVVSMRVLDRWRYQQRLERLQRDLDHESHERQTLETSQRSLQLQLETLEEQATNHQRTIEALKTQLQERDRLLQKERTDLEAIRTDVEQTWDEQAALQGELSHLRDYVAELEAELNTSQSNLASLLQYQPKPAEAGENNSETDELVCAGAFETVLAAVETAEQQFGDVLEIWDSARSAAAESQFGRPSEVYQALRAIAEIGRASLLAKREGRSMGGWREGFRAYGLDFKPTEHQVTGSRYGSDRDFRHGGRKQRMFKHLTLGKNNAVHNLQIYFELDFETEKVAIGYCGKHLRSYGWAS
ncbi:hypothetical protein H6G51_15285 [Limnothrix sp. FACHB-708]|uniref:hypothetical protein n=1 Tax=unclassified Limnothrix TaxID=2632864 RepID=UPI001681E306|nr:MULTISPECIES: hypothetical protein [unclassified Limnothrix]MBD2554649.1 hypothetical protein [Limnothrix sp. FACHB-708]MBD2591682.1 hypothetical protein [Limnothrix sp. FACHB-406]